ncbi:hypothetical protein KM176_13095 [Pseudooceanicola sp. CBS1P-1]|uniref:hypothetical protein n=1 Tax=Pseudooceanicola TaxID=1679449 RepID=UPI0019259EE9|nr:MULTISPECIES: hypothetical protein [Pseudooceanicola]MBT9384799.1 hypothetical protein [Pseudooceanicola endophyticus]
MDYSKSGGSKGHGKGPKHVAENSRANGKPGKDGRSTKEELLARMKAAAEAKKKG